VGRCTGLLVVACLLAGCSNSSSYGGGYSGSCKYKRASDSTDFRCRGRPQPDAALLARAMAPNALPRAIARFEHAHRGTPLLAIGLNHWGETTFTVGPDHFHKQLITYDIDDRPTSGDDGYVSSYIREPIALSDVDPGVLAQVLAKAREADPQTTLVSAEISHGAFSDVPQWRVGLIGKDAKADILYRVGADGSGLCHGDDYNTQDGFVPVAGVPACADNVMPL
jgi:hypothetical protein